MHNILVPVDYSQNSKVALQYACAITQKTSAEILLLHCSHVPIIPAETPLEIYDSVIRNQEIHELQALNNYKSEVFDELPASCQDTKCAPVHKQGLAVDEITEMANSGNIDLVVMGTKGASGLKKMLMGSITTRVISRAHCPVLAIPEEARFTEIHKIAFATDFHALHNPKVLDHLRHYCRLFNASLMLFFVAEKKDHLPTAEQAVEGLKLENALTGIKHNYYFSESDDVIDAIDNFIDVQKPDLLIMAPHHHDYLERLLGKSITKEMAYHTHIPLLTLPDRKPDESKS